MQPSPAENRREHERIRLQPMYTTVTVQRLSSMRIAPLEGHAYDISPGGLRFEVDEALDVGEPVHIRVTLPGTESIAFRARIVRVFDIEDDPGPRRAGARITAFATTGDRHRLMQWLGAVEEHDAGLRAA